MIAKMIKYDLVLYAAQSEDFIEKLRELGLVDITTTGWEPSEADRQLLLDIEGCAKAAEFLKAFRADGDRCDAGAAPFASGEEAYARYAAAQQQAAPQQQAKASLSPELNSALLKLQEAVVKEPNKAENWIKLGNFQFDNQNPSAAVTAYENALRLKPGNANVLTDLGIMYRELHRFEDALKAFREAERVQPGHRNALFNQGIVLYYDLKRKDEAEAAWRKLLAADPNAHAPDGTPVSELIKHLH